MADELAEFITRATVPQADGSIPTTGEYLLAVRGKGCRIDAEHLAGEDAELLYPSVLSHKRAVLSALPVSTCWPSGEKAAAWIADEWPRNRRSSLPVALSHERAVRSSLPVSTSLPSEEKAAALIQLECPVNRRSSLPVAQSHKCAVLSQLP